MRDVLVYSVLRLGMFLVVWALLIFVAGMHYLVAGAFAALITMLLSIILLGGPRDGAAQRWKAADEARRARKADEVADVDAAEEDALVDGAEQGRSTGGAASALPENLSGRAEDEAQQQED